MTFGRDLCRDGATRPGVRDIPRFQTGFNYKSVNFVHRPGAQKQPAFHGKTGNLAAGRIGRCFGASCTHVLRRSSGPSLAWALA